MRNALFLAVGLTLSMSANAADDERCVVSFSTAQQNVCSGKIAAALSRLDALFARNAVKDSTLRFIKFD